MRTSSILPIAALALTTACATPQHGRTPANQLESALQFKELTADNKEISLSTESPDGTRQIPTRIEVDINSTIEVDFVGDKIKTTASLPDSSLITKLSEDQKDLQQALSILSQTIDARIAALRAHEQKRFERTTALEATTTTASAFINAVKEFGKQEQKLTELPLWDRGLFNEEEQTRAFEDPTYHELGVLLQSRLQNIEKSLHNAIENANRGEAKLRLAAFLESPGASPFPIHLPGYDELEAKELQIKSNDALVISSKERKALEEQFTAIKGFAYQAERIRTNEAALDEALMKAGKEAAARFPAILEKAKPVLATDWAGKTKSLKRATSEFNAKLGPIATELAEKEKGYWAQLASPISTDLTQAFPIEDLQGLTASLSMLQKNWRECSPETLIQTLTQTRDATTQALSLSARLRRQDLSPLLNSWSQFINAINTRPEEVKQDTWNSIRQAAIESGLQDELTGLQTNVRDIQALADAVAQTVQFASINPSRADIQVSKQFEVPILTAPRTRIELQRTPRAINDRISFNATVTAATETITSETIFSVRQFGWHSILAPSVILSRPVNSRSSFDQDFKFAPAIAWTYKYYPRQWEEGWLAATARFLKVGGGLHIAFLDQTPQKDTEIGIGLALSFWDDRLVTGAGWDLMDNSRTYVYIGSNLIPILQALGFGDATNAGKKP